MEKKVGLKIQGVMHLHFGMSEFWTDGQTVMHMSPSCKLHRWAKMITYLTVGKL